MYRYMGVNVRSVERTETAVKILCVLGVGGDAGRERCIDRRLLDNPFV
jgi:hypothetical protein